MDYVCYGNDIQSRIYAVIRLLLATDERTEEERLDAAKKHYQSVKYGRIDKSHC